MLKIIEVLPDLVSKSGDWIIPSAQPQKHKRKRSAIPCDAEIIEISDSETSDHQQKTEEYFFFKGIFIVLDSVIHS